MEREGVTEVRPYDQRLAAAFARRLAPTGISPNAMTTVGLLAGLAAGALFAVGGPFSPHLGALVFVYAVFNDHVDGELARFTGRMSEFGHYFDHVAACVSYLSMFVGAGIGLGQAAGEGWAVPFGIIAGLSVVAIFSVRLWVEETVDRAAVRQKQYGGFEVEDLLYLVGPITWLGGLSLFIAAAGIGTPIFLLWVVWQALRARRAAGEP
ncbi:MAG: CDP-alcohol phosphatidyltransferase family protein [Alphaproteobacteria bacterium]